MTNSARNCQTCNTEIVSLNTRHGVREGVDHNGNPVALWFCGDHIPNTMLGDWNASAMATHYAKPLDIRGLWGRKLAA